jgi:Protein of unknown function (DUF3822)
MPSEPSFQICSPAFSIDDIGGYALNLELDKAAIKLSVFQASDLIALEEYTFDKKSDITDLIAQYQEIIDEHVFLKANYWASITVTTESPFLFPIAKELFDKSQIPTYETLFFQKTLAASYVQHENQETVFLMAYDTEIQDFIETIYPNKGIEVQSTLFKLAKSFQESQASESTTIYCSENYFTAYFWDAGKFVLECFGMQDFDKKILKVKSSSENCILFGQITTFHPFYNKLKTTFKNLSFGTLPATLKTLSFMAELPAYKYISLLA